MTHNWWALIKAIISTHWPFMAGTQFRLERGRLQLLMSTIDQENAISPNCNVINLSALLE